MAQTMTDTIGVARSESTAGISSTAPDPSSPATETKVLVAAMSQAASTQAAAIENQFLTLTNAARSAAGVALVSRDPDLEAYARTHVVATSFDGHIYHSNISSLLGPWWLIGENVGVGPNAFAIEHAYEASPPHYENLADPAFKYVGIGVVIDTIGRVFTAEVYGI
jgi:uncharacterized protein YkwD